MTLSSIPDLRRSLPVPILLTLAILAGSLPVAEASPLAAPSMHVSPDSGPAGSTVSISGSGYTPGLTASVLWDGSSMDIFNLSDTGSFSEPFIVPPSASPGTHTISVCSGNPCFTGEFAETASDTFTVTVPPTPTGTVPPEGLVDYQIMAAEVTQGVRGDIPIVGAPTSVAGRGLIYQIFDTDVTHVANKRTVVRVYANVVLRPGGASRPVDVELRRVTSADTVSAPIHPLTRYLTPTPGQALDTMRANAALSWNFVLPQEWVQEGQQIFQIRINAAAGQRECSGCTGNNTVFLYGVNFTRYHTEPVDVRIYLADLKYYDADHNVVRFIPSAVEVSNAINYWLKVWPVDPSLFHFSYRYSQISQNPWGYRLDAMGNNVREVDPPIPGWPQWENQVYIDENPDLLESRVFLRPPYSFIPLLFDPDSWMGCSGNAGIGYTPLFHAGACGPTVAQEATHSISINHAGNSHGEDGGGGHNPDYPGVHGQVESNAYGFDVWTNRALPPTEGEGHRHDFMSYGGGDYWVSIYTWEGLADLYDGEAVEVGRFNPGGLHLASLTWPYPGVAARQSDQEYLRISGSLLNDGDLRLDTIFTVDAPTRAAPTGSSPFTLRLEDDEGDVLYEQPLTLVEVTEEGVQSFYELVPIVDGLARIAFVRDGEVVAAKLASATPPTVDLTSVNPGDQWAGEGELTVSWEGQDPDGDPLTYRLQVSPDGTTWVTLIGDTPRTEEVVNLAYIPGWGEDWKIRVVVSDGVHVSSDTVDGVSLAAKPPIPMILQPQEGGFLASGRALEPLGQAFDYMDGSMSGESLAWLLDGVAVGQGDSILVEELSDGQHRLRLEATNTAGLTSGMDVAFVVGQDTDSDGMPDTWEEEHGLRPKDGSDASGDKDRDGLSNLAEFENNRDPNDSTDGTLPSISGDHVYPAGPTTLQIEGSEGEAQATPEADASMPESATEPEAAGGQGFNRGLGILLMVVGALLVAGVVVYAAWMRRRASR